MAENGVRDDAISGDLRWHAPSFTHPFLHTQNEKEALGLNLSG